MPSLKAMHFAGVVGALLALRKGAKARLLRFRRASRELLRCQRHARARRARVTS
jgi:hypothetical protein